MAANKGNKGNPNQAAQTAQPKMGAAFDEALQKTHQNTSAQPQPQTQAPNMNAQPNPQQGGQRQNQNQGQGRRSSIMDINSLMSRPMSRRSTGEITLQFQDALGKLMERNFKQGFDNAFQLLVLDNNVANVGPLSTLLCCYHEQHNGQHFVAVYSLLVEGSSEALQPKTYNIGGRSVAIDTVPGDVFNDHLWGKISDHIQQTHGRKMTVLDAGAMVLPRELSHEDELHMRMVLFNASQACFTVMEHEVGGKEAPFTVAMVNTADTNLTAKLAYSSVNDAGSGQSESSTGQPIRSDVRITLQGGLNQQYTDTGFEQTRELTGVDGFVDLVYSPPQQAAMGQQVQTQHYYPRLVITRMDTQIDAITMELQLLGLAQSTLLSRNMAWAGVFRQNHEAKGLDLRDIGAIGYEVNLTGDPQAKPEKVDTKAKSFDINALYQLVHMSINDVLLYSMDIEEVGELSWIHQAFIASANGNQDAYQLIIDSANTLTNGYFAQRFQGGPIAVDDQNRIHLGYYKDSQNNLRDLRDIDYLAMLNISGKDDPATVAKWGETFDNKDIPLEIRLEERANILRGVLSNNMHIKGYARRITFNPEFIIALNLACADAGLAIRPQNLVQEFTGGQARGNFNAGQFGVSGQAVGGLFNASQSPWGNQHQQGFANFQGRYGRQW
mgnify:CR=1 FL=1